MLQLVSILNYLIYIYKKKISKHHKLLDIYVKKISKHHRLLDIYKKKRV